MARPAERGAVPKTKEEGGGATVAEDYSNVLQAACRAGKIMLESGGETGRVEQTMAYICKALGAAWCESYATPTSIMLSIAGEDGKVHTLMQRISARGVNLGRVEAVNTLSRTVLQVPTDAGDIQKRLDEVEKMPQYSLPVLVAASAFGTAAFTMVFGGNAQDFACGLATGAVLRLFCWLLAKLRMNDFFINLAGGALAALMGWTAFTLGLGGDWWVIALSALMLLVPGLLITNALRDIAAGDLISGLSRGTEAFCIAIALALGAAATYAGLQYLGGF